MAPAGWQAPGSPSSGGEKEHRYSLPNTRFMIHQPLGGVRGQATDIEIEAREIIRMLERVNKLIADATGQPLEKVKKDTDRNFWMSPAEALDYGIVGKLITHYDELNLGLSFSLRVRRVTASPYPTYTRSIDP